MVNRKRVIAAVVSSLLIGLVVLMVFLRPKDHLAGLVPDHASWYVEVDKPIDILKSLKKGLRLFSDPGLTLFSEWQEELALAEDLFRKEPQVYAFIKESTLGISAHAITGKEASYLFYIGLPQKHHNQFFELLQREYGRGREFRFEKREYLGKAIAEVTFLKTGAVFSLASSEDALIGSYSGFLVEEVVRQSGVFFKPNFASRLRRDSRYTAFSNRPVRLFLNLKNLPVFLFQFLTRQMEGLSLSSSAGDALLIGLDAPNGLEWKSEGYLLTEEPKEKGRRPNPLNARLRDFLPESSVLSYQFSSRDVWGAFPGRKMGQEGRYEILDKALGPEILLGLTEGEGLRKYNHVLISPIQSQKLLDQFLMLPAESGIRDGLFRENYNGVWIFQHPDPGLAFLIGGSLMKDWIPAFCARSGNFFLLSDDLDAMRQSLEKGISRSSNPSPGPLSHHIRLQFHPSKTIPLFMESATGVFRKNFQEWVPILKILKEARLEDLGEDENPSVSLTLHWKMDGTVSVVPHEIKRVFLDSTLLTPPFRLEPRNSGRTYWMLQDIKMQAHLIGPDLQQVFRVPMQERWISRPQLLETRKSDNFNILVSMSHSIRMLDQKGEFKPGFLVQLPDSQSNMEHVRVVDYDNSLQYRFFISSRYGPVFVADLEGNFLEGWKPFSSVRPLVSAPRHIRIGEKDLILMVDNMGSVLVTNRKGEMQQGFPYALKGRSNQPVFVEPGLGLKNSYLYSLSELGQMEKISLEGSPASGIQLFRPDKNTRFLLCPDQKQKTFSVARISGNAITVFDQGYRPVFDFKTKGTQILIQHFQFGASNKVYAILDQEFHLCHLFNEAGVLLTPEPLEATQPIDIIPKPGPEPHFLLLAPFENRLSLYEFEKE